MRVLFIIRGLEGAEPLGIMYIAAVLQQAGHEVRLLPTRGIELDAEIAAFAPQIIGFGVCIGQHDFYLRLNRHRHQYFSRIRRLEESVPLDFRSAALRETRRA